MRSPPCKSIAFERGEERRVSRSVGRWEGDTFFPGAAGWTQGEGKGVLEVVLTVREQVLANVVHSADVDDGRHRVLLSRRRGRAKRKNEGRFFRARGRRRQPGKRAKVGGDGKRRAPPRDSSPPTSGVLVVDRRLALFSFSLEEGSRLLFALWEGAVSFFGGRFVCKVDTDFWTSLLDKIFQPRETNRAEREQGGESRASAAAAASMVSTTMLTEIAGRRRALARGTAGSRREPDATHRSRARTPLSVRCAATEGDERTTTSRRSALSGSVALAATVASSLADQASLATRSQALAIAEKPVEVQNYLTEAANIAGFYEFVPSDRETPAIRAGTIGKYKFAMPGTWIRRTVANILSGNYCQPRCDEPWTEVLFQGPKEGSLQVIVSPLNKLSRRSLAAGESIDTVGTLDGIINALGPNITGNTIEQEEVAEAKAETIDGVTYFWYTLDTPYGKTGQHQVSSLSLSHSLSLFSLFSLSCAFLSCASLRRDAFSVLTTSVSFDL